MQNSTQKKPRRTMSNRCRYTLPTRLYLHTSGEIRRRHSLRSSAPSRGTQISQKFTNGSVLIALMRNQPKQAVAHYRTAIEKKPYVQSAYYNLAKAYRLLGDTPAATQQLKLFHQMKTYYDRTYAIESALTEDPTNATLRSELADIHLANTSISLQRHRHLPSTHSV